jgi:hypothetical protein
MTARPDRTSLPRALEATHHELEPVRVHGRLVGVRLTVRHAADGAWRGHLRFSAPGALDRETAEIFCADSEADLWRAVRSLGEHHLHALYQSLA